MLVKLSNVSKQARFWEVPQVVFLHKCVGIFRANSMSNHPITINQFQYSIEKIIFYFCKVLNKIERNDKPSPSFANVTLTELKNTSKFVQILFENENIIWIFSNINKLSSLVFLPNRLI